MNVFIADHILGFIIGLGVLCPLLCIGFGLGCYLYVRKKREQDQQLSLIRQYFCEGFKTELRKTETGEVYIFVKSL